MKGKNEQTTRAKNGWVVLRQSAVVDANIDEEKEKYK
jgi:hypothetical protein